jgi:hypothetical protein
MILLVLAIGYIGYQRYELNSAIDKDSLATKADMDMLRKQTNTLSGQLNDIKNTNEKLQSEIDELKNNSKK